MRILTLRAGEIIMTNSSFYSNIPCLNPLKMPKGRFRGILWGGATIKYPLAARCSASCEGEISRSVPRGRKPDFRHGLLKGQTNLW